jgi:hypothetical protein
MYRRTSEGGKSRPGEMSRIVTGQHKSGELSCSLASCSVLLTLPVTRRYVQLGQ